MGSGRYRRALCHSRSRLCGVLALKAVHGPAVGHDDGNEHQHHALGGDPVTQRPAPGHHTGNSGAVVDRIGPGAGCPPACPQDEAEQHGGHGEVQQAPMLWKRGGVSTDRGNLYKNFVDLVAQNPKVFVAENVKGILLQIKTGNQTD